MAKILVCIDGSAYADNICTHAAWVAKRLNAEVDLLHVLRRHSEYEAPADHTGAIGLGARGSLLEALTKVDEERGRLDQQKGKIILEHGAQVLKEAGVETVNIIHRRGSLVETIQEFEKDVEMIFLGKRGEHADKDSVFLGSNLEKVARIVTKPLFVMPLAPRPIERFLIAYDGKDSISKAIDYITEKPLLKGLECHLLSAGDVNVDLSEAEQKLRDAGFKIITKSEKDGSVDSVISSYVVENKIDLLIAGAYSHSRIRSLLLGSTTASLIKYCRIPLLLFR